MSAISEKRDLLAAQGIVFGVAKSEERDTPNKLGKYQEFEKGILFDTSSYAVAYLSEKVMGKWKSPSVATAKTHKGGTIQAYLGFPIADTAKSNDGSHICFFERGMIVCRPNGSSFVVYGDIFIKYMSTKAKEFGSPFPNWMGYPTADVVVGASDGLVGRFENADIYWHASLGAYEVHGGCRDRYNNLGQTTSVLGYPTSDEHDILKDSKVIGRSNTFQQGGIYWTAKTGAWEVHGSLYASYIKEYGGPVGNLGFPLSNETKSPTDQYRFNNFERGVLTWQTASGTVRKVTKVDLRVTNIETRGKADKLNSDDPFLIIKISPSIPIAGFKPDYSLPSSDNGNEGIDSGTGGRLFYDNMNTITVQPNNANVCSIPITDGNQRITISIETWDYDSFMNGNDNVIGNMTAVYDIDSLWDTTASVAVARNPSALNFNNQSKVSFNFKADGFIANPFDTANFRKNLWWDIQNYGIGPLSREVYANTFSDVEQNEFLPFHLFNAIFFEAVYKSIAEGGICFGMCLEGIYALKERSVSNEPISQYNDHKDGRYGLNPKLKPYPDPIRNNSFQIKHGYQVGGDMMQYYLSQGLDGEMWNPVSSFNRSKEMFDRGDFPIIVMSKTASPFGVGHAVVPYKWDNSNPKKLIIWVANPNSPISAENSKPDSGMNIITIFNETGRIEFSFENQVVNGVPDLWTGRQGAFKGGRMFPIPFCKLSTVPRTPALEIGVALIALAGLAVLTLGGALVLPLAALSAVTGGVLIIFSGTTDANQITDGSGRTYFDGDDGMVVYDPAKRIDNLAHVAGIGANFPGKRPNFFIHRSPLIAEAIYDSKASTKSKLSEKWTYPHLATVVNSRNFWSANTTENVNQKFETTIASAIMDVIKRTLGKSTLSFDMANKGDANYEWLMSTRHAKFKIDSNAVANNSDKITIDGINTAGQALSFVPNNAKSGKKITTTITNYNNSLLFTLANIKVAAGEPVTFQHSNGGKKVMVYNSNNDTNVDVMLTYKTNVVDSVNLGTTPLAKNSITTFEVLSTTTIKKEVYTELGGKPISSMSYANVSLDCRSLGHRWLVIQNAATGEYPICKNPPTNMGDAGAFFFCPNRVVNFLLEDGTYTVILQSGNLSIIQFTVKDGIIGYNPELEGVITGKGTSTLVLRGLPITIDATEVEGFVTYIPGVYGLDGFDTDNAFRPLFTGNLLPNCHDATDGWDYWINIDSGVVASFLFKVCLNGTVTYKPAFDDSVKGRGTNVLKISKYTPR